MKEIHKEIYKEIYLEMSHSMKNQSLCDIFVMQIIVLLKNVATFVEMYYNTSKEERQYFTNDYIIRGEVKTCAGIV